MNNVEQLMSQQDIIADKFAIHEMVEKKAFKFIRTLPSMAINAPNGK